MRWRMVETVVGLHKGFVFQGVGVLLPLCGPTPAAANSKENHTKSTQGRVALHILILILIVSTKLGVQGEGAVRGRKHRAQIE